MPLLHEGQEYLNATEAAFLLNVSRQHFYDVIQPIINSHYVGRRTKPYYLREEVLKAGEVRTEKPLPILIHGIQKNFVKSIQELGIPCVAKNVGTPSEVSVTDQQLADLFQLKLGDPIIRRGRLQGVEGTPYRLVCNWYPTRYCDAELLEEMRKNEDADMPVLMKQKYGVTIEPIVELVSVRKSSPEERKILHLRQHETVYEIRRINYATNGTDVVMVSDLVLVARYFRLKYTYKTENWINQ